MVPEPQPPREWSEPIALFALTGLLVVGIAVGAFRHTRTLRSQARAQAEAQLAAVSDLKVRELSLWRHERQVDATAFNSLVGFPALVRRVLENPLDRGSEQALLTGLQAFLAQGEFDQARLLDATGRERLSLPASAPPMSSAIHQVAMAALVSGRAVLQDFYRSPIDQKIYLKWLVPVTDDREPTRRIGLLALRIDPNRSLYPYILHWPTPSTSAETLLVRREGQEAVYLNDLRFHPGAALELRVPLHQSRIPAALAVLGQTGITEGPDYRGTAVLADLRPVPDSPWFLVTRMDRSEVFAPYRKDLRETALIAGALSLALVGGAVAIWRHQRMADFRNRYAVERESAWLKQVITRSREEIYIFATDTLQFLFVNAGAMQNLGYSLDELSRMTPVDFKPEFTEARFRAAIQPLLSGQQELLTFQTVHRRKNGTKYPVEVRLQCVDRGSDTVFLAIIRDITERRQAERVILTANQKLDLHAQQTPLAVIEWDLV
jgi:PAS domain S-box-containing protein